MKLPAPIVRALVLTTPLLSSTLGDGKTVQEGEVVTLLECRPLVRADEAVPEPSANGSA